MTQLVTRVSEELATAIDDELVAGGLAANRSAVVRLAVERLLAEERRRRRIEHEIDAYTRQPQTEEEQWGIDRSTREMIEEEPW